MQGGLSFPSFPRPCKAQLSWHRVPRVLGTSHPLGHPGGMPSGPICGFSCLGVGAVGEVGDRDTIGEDLAGGRGHPQDGHLPQLQASPLTSHVHQLVHDGVLVEWRGRSEVSVDGPGSLAGDWGGGGLWIAAPCPCANPQDAGRCMRTGSERLAHRLCSLHKPDPGTGGPHGSPPA